MAQNRKTRGRVGLSMVPAIPLVLVAWACGSGTGAEMGEQVCGDGVKAPDELCDDGNRTAGDGCSADCVPSGTQLECVPLLEGHWDNGANALLPMPDQTFVVAGELTDGNSTYGWVARYSESGEQLWFEQLTSPDGDARVDALTPDGKDGTWALVSSPESGLVPTSGSPELRHFSRDGLADATIDLDSAFGAPSLAAYATEYVEGSVWIGGSVWSGDASQLDFWLGRYDLKTDVAATLVLEDHLGFEDEIHALGRTADEVVAAATVSTSPNWDWDWRLNAKTDIVLLHFDLQGNEIGRVLAAADPDSEFARVAEEVISDGHGSWYAGGTQQEIGGWPTLPWGVWLGKIELSPAWSWDIDTLIDERTGSSFGAPVVVDRVVALAFGVYIEGSEGIHGEGWVTGFKDDGEVSWRQTSTYAGYSHYEEQQIVLDHSSRLRTVGKAWTQDLGSQLRTCILAW
jgi:cysteine-rich repeat protein